jgi:hypothetical protein
MNRAEKIVARLLEDDQPSKPAIARMGTGPIARYRNTLGDPMGTLYYATPEDWAEWQRLNAKGMPVLGPEAAPKEAMKNKYGGNPPLPPQ